MTLFLLVNGGPPARSLSVRYVVNQSAKTTYEKSQHTRKLRRRSHP